MTSSATHRAAVGDRVPARAECTIDLGALAHNVTTLRARLRGATQLWAVVKANGYGHSAVEVARAAVSAGASRLCVSTVTEARQLREAGIDAPLLTMGPLDVEAVREASRLDASVTLVGPDMVRIAIESGVPLRAHLKVDTGMGRWGVAHDAALATCDLVAGTTGVVLEGLMTHFATADEPERAFLDSQLVRFDALVAAVRERHPDVVAHAANSAATLLDERTHFDAVRCGIAIYGLSPRQDDPDSDDLRPVMSVTSRVAEVKDIATGDSVGYGRRFIADCPARTALVPIGYADGIMRALSGRAEALIGGRRFSFAGVVSMDHLSLVVDPSVTAGDLVTLIGTDGDDRVTAEEHARIAGTINYEVTCGIACEPRLPRAFTGG